MMKNCGNTNKHDNNDRSTGPKRREWKPNIYANGDVNREC